MKGSSIVSRDTEPELVSVERTLTIALGSVELEADLCIPPGARAVVLFAHGSGSSHRSPRNQFVAAALRERGLGTLLFDLLTPAEERRDEPHARLRFDIPFLAERVGAATDWLRLHDATKDLQLCYFGASTGAAAALVAAAERPLEVNAVVSRGGRPDLARNALNCVRAPTMLIVGEDDHMVLQLNRQALERLPGPKQLVIVPGASHLFEEPGALEEVARAAGDWFLANLRIGAPGQPLSHLSER